MERDRERVAEPLVLEEGVFVVLQPRPARRRQQVVVGEGEVERGERRAERQPEEADQPGRQEQVAGARCAARRAATRSERAGDAARRRPSNVQHGRGPSWPRSAIAVRRVRARPWRSRSSPSPPASTSTFLKATDSQAGSQRALELAGILRRRRRQRADMRRDDVEIVDDLLLGVRQRCRLMRSRMLASPETPRSISRMSLAASSVMKKFISCAAASGSGAVAAIEMSIDGFRYWPGLPVLLVRDHRDVQLVGHELLDWRRAGWSG